MGADQAQDDAPCEDGNGASDRACVGDPARGVVVTASFGGQPGAVQGLEPDEEVYTCHVEA